MPPWWRCRFRLHEAIRGGGWCSRLPVVKKGCRFCLREEVHGGWRSGLPVVQRGRWFCQRGENRGGPAFGQSSESEALQKALDGKGSAQDIKAALESYRAARKDKESKLASAQETLRKVLSVRQEAQAVLLGLLP